MHACSTTFMESTFTTRYTFCPNRALQGRIMHDPDTAQLACTDAHEQASHEARCEEHVVHKRQFLHERRNDGDLAHLLEREACAVADIGLPKKPRLEPQQRRVHRTHRRGSVGGEHKEELALAEGLIEAPIEGPGLGEGIFAAFNGQGLGQVHHRDKHGLDRTRDECDSYHNWLVVNSGIIASYENEKTSQVAENP